MDTSETGTQSASRIGARSRLKSMFALGPKAWRGAALSLLICTAVLFLSITIGGGVHSFANGVANLVFAVLLAALSLSLGSLIVKVLGLIQKLQQPYRWVLFGSLFLLIAVLVASVHRMSNAVAVALYLVIVASLLGAGIAAWIAARKENRSWRAPAAFSTVGAVGLCLLVAWFAWPGQPYTVPEPVHGQAAQPPDGLTHPAETGPYNVLELTYGSGTDKHRSEYGDDVDITTDSADVSAMVGKPIAPVLWLRNTFWGFGLDEVPLNARVWYPDGDGPFPLVLVVHGNHMMDDFSDPGYDYLGELLAGRGYIVASVDQNFLNGGGFIEAILGGLSTENDARAYLLLRHLSLWHAWNETEGHPFEGMVDTDNIGLIGHSRGGEAAAITAAFNHLPFHPGNADIAFDFGYNIRSIIAIAPSDGQYMPRRQRTELSDVNYLVLQGSADADVRSFQGARQYDRVSLAEGSDLFKAAVYIHGANHGQFNTRWGRIDVSFSRLFLDRSNIMPADVQELTAKTFISGFLEDTLRGHREYQQLFTDPSVRRYWLPDTFSHIQYRDGATMIIADFEEDMDLTTITIEGGRAAGENLVSWREEPLELGYGALRGSTSVRLAWDVERQGEASYTLVLPEGFAEQMDATSLTFALAGVSPGRAPLDFTIAVRDSAGEEASLPLSHIAPLPPPPQYRMFKWPLGVQFLSEPVFTTYTFPLSDFVASNGAFDPRAVAEIRFLFDNSSGALFLDDVGLNP